MSLFTEIIIFLDRRFWVIGILGFSFALFAIQSEPVVWVQKLWKVYAISCIITAILFSPYGKTVYEPSQDILLTMKSNNQKYDLELKK